MHKDLTGGSPGRDEPDVVCEGPPCPLCGRRLKVLASPLNVRRRRGGAAVTVTVSLVCTCGLGREGSR